MSDSLRVIAERRADAKIEFYKCFTIYLIVNAALAVVNYIFTPEFWWVAFLVFFWGIGIAVKFLNAFVFSSRFGSEEWGTKNSRRDEKTKEIKYEGKFICFRRY